MAAHSKIGASSMHRWSKCPGSVQLSQGIPSRTSAHAEEGTRAHEMAAAFLIDGSAGDPEAKDYDTEMADNLRVYIDEIEKLRKPKGSSSYIEHRFNLDNIYPGAFGTADAVVYDPNTKILHVCDLKYGAGVAVEVVTFEKDSKGNTKPVPNPQLAFYGLGALLSTGHPAETVELMIVQPRAPHQDGPIRRWPIDAIDLTDFAADLVKYAKATEAKDAPLLPGDWCRWCPAAGVCPSIAAKAQEKAKLEFKPTFSYDEKVLSETLHWLPILETWIKGVREFAYAEAEHGRPAPGWKLVEKRATRKWQGDEDTTAAELKKRFIVDDDDIFEKKLLTPAKVEALIGKTNAKKMEDLVVKESSGCTLAPDADKRPAIRKDPKVEFEAVT